MLERFYPNEYVNSVEDIDFDMYYKQGIRGVIFDIDNTLVPHGHPATDKSIEFFEKLRKIGLDTCLISNNQEPRLSHSLMQLSQNTYLMHINLQLGTIKKRWN